MRETELFVVVNGLPVGKAITISERDMREAAGGSPTGFNRVGGTRDYETAEFVATISRNWGVVIVRNPITDSYTIHKPDEDAGVFFCRPMEVAARDRRFTEGGRPPRTEEAFIIKGRKETP